MTKTKLTWRQRIKIEDPERLRILNRLSKHRQMERRGAEVRAQKKRWRLANLDKEKQYERKRKKRDKRLSNRASALRRRYGISYTEFCAMIARQRGRCAVCQETFKHTPYVDHHHAEMIIRELLCARCNVVVGVLEDKVCSLALEYIVNHGGNLDHIFGGRRAA